VTNLPMSFRNCQLTRMAALSPPATNVLDADADVGISLNSANDVAEPFAPPNLDIVEALMVHVVLGDRGGDGISITCRQDVDDRAPRAFCI
jgi:hypothetical protein